MAIFRYKVSDARGTVSEQTAEGESQAEATRRLQRRGLVPLEFLGEGLAAAGGPAAGRWFRRFNVLDFIERLTPLVEAHIPLERALGIIAAGLADRPDAATVVQDLRKGLHEGRKFSQLLRDRNRLFPGMVASVVEAGEEAGALPAVLADLRRFLNENRELRTTMLTASIYPAVIVAVSLAVLGILLGVIIPKFAAILQGSGMKLAWSTKLLLGLSELVRGWWWLLPVLVAGAVLFFWRSRHDERIRAWRDRALLRLPLVRAFILCSNLARMTRTMSILMRSGVPLLDTVAIAARVVENAEIRRSLTGIGGELRQGQRLSAALGGNPFIPPYLLSMLVMGEESGDVPGMLERVAERYETDLRGLIRKILALFEPAMIIFIAAIVALIVIAMFIALINMTQLPVK